MVNQGGTTAAGATPASGRTRRSSREHRWNHLEALCNDKATLRRLPCVFLCRACQSVLGDSTSLVAAYSLPDPSNMYSVTSTGSKKTMVALRATTRNVLQAEDGELSCACGVELGRAVDHDTYAEGDLWVLNGSFQMDTSALIRYRIGLDAEMRYDGDESDDAVDATRHVEGRARQQHNQHQREGNTGWDDVVRDTLMDLKRRVRALESNFNHHDRELTDHFNTIRTLEAMLGGTSGGPGSGT